jgi:hypothetical protein
MYYLVKVDHNGMAAHLTRRDCEGSNVVDGTDDDMLWNDSEEVGDVRIGVSVTQMKALNVKVEKVTLIGTGRQKMTCFVC